MTGNARLRIAVLVLGILSPGAILAQQSAPDGSAAGEISRLVDRLRQQGAAVEQGTELAELPPAIQELHGHGEAAVAPLADLLHDRSPWARWQAAWCLAELASSGIDVAQTLPALVECAEQDQLRPLHYPCVTALGHSGDARAVPVLRSALASPSYEVVFAAMKALSRVRLAEAGLPAEIRATARRLEQQGRQDRFHIERFVERVLLLDTDPRIHPTGPVNRLTDAVERMLMLSRVVRSRQLRIALLRAAYEIDSPPHAEGAVQALSSLDEPEAQQLAAALPELIEQGDADAAAELTERWHIRIIDAAHQKDTTALRCLTAVVGIYPGDAVVLWTIADLADIGPPAVTAMLEELAESSQPDIRRNLVFGLGDLASHVLSDNPLSAHLLEEVVPVLEEIGVEDPSLAEEAQTAIYRIRFAPTIDQITAAARRGDGPVLHELVQSLMSRGVSLYEGRTHSTYEVPRRLIGTVRTLPPDDPAVDLLLAELRALGETSRMLRRELMSASTWRDRIALINVADRLGLESAELAAELEKLVADEHPWVREAAARALNKVRPTDDDTD